MSDYGSGGGGTGGGGGLTGAAPLSIVPTKPEAEIAAELKARAVELLKPLCELMDEAAAKGLAIQFDGIGMGMAYRHEALRLRVAKIY